MPGPAPLKRRLPCSDGPWCEMFQDTTRRKHSWTQGVSGTSPWNPPRLCACALATRRVNLVIADQEMLPLTALASRLAACSRCNAGESQQARKLLSGTKVSALQAEAEATLWSEAIQWPEAIPSATRP